MTASTVIPLPPPPASSPRRVWPWRWLIVAGISFVALASLGWMYAGASSLSDAKDARLSARTGLTRSRTTEHSDASRLAADRKTAAAQAERGHQILDRSQNEVALRTQQGTLSRQSIAAAVNGNIDQFNATRDQFNALVAQSNAVTAEINTLLAQLSGASSLPTSPPPTSGV